MKLRLNYTDENSQNKRMNGNEKNRTFIVQFYMMSLVKHSLVSYNYGV